MPPISASGPKVIIVVMGVTGVGKSTFIQYATGHKVDMGHGWMPCTTEVQLYPIPDTNVCLVDTPGFDNIYKSDADILKAIADCLADCFASKWKVSGVLYIHHILEARLTRTMIKNLRLFAKVIGENNMSKCCLVTSKWSLLPKTFFKSIETELKNYEELWKPLLELGAVTARFEDTMKSAIDIIRPLAGSQGFLPQLIKETEIDKKPLLGTEAGKELNDNLEEAQRRHLKVVLKLREQQKEAIRKRDTELAKAIEADQVEFEEELRKMNEEHELLRQKREQGSSNRIKRWFARTDAAIVGISAMVATDSLLAPAAALLYGTVETAAQVRFERTAQMEDLEEATRRTQQTGDVTSQDVAMSNLASPLENQGKLDEVMSMKEEVLEKERKILAEEHPETISAMNSLANALGEQGKLDEAASMADSDDSSQDETGPERAPRSRIAQRQNTLADSASPRHPRQSRGSAPDTGRPFTTRRDKQRRIRSARVRTEENSIVARFARTPSEKRQSIPMLTDALGRSPTANNDLFGLKERQGIPALKQALDRLLIADKQELVLLKERFEACFHYSSILRDTVLWLRREDLVDQQITILTCDTRRAVVCLAPIHTIEFTHLLGALDDLIRGHRSLSPRLKPTHDREGWDFKEFAQFMRWKSRCWANPAESGLWLVSKTLLPEDDASAELRSSSPKDIVLLVEGMELALQILDVALITHMSAHVCQDQSALLQSGGPELALPLNAPDQRVLRFKQRRLACLSGLTGPRTVWVFQRSDETIREPLYLSTSIEDFALVWGPVWKVPLREKEATFKQYNVGGGSIVPWKYEDDVHPQLHDNERLCHWTRLEDDGAAHWSDSSDGSEQISMDEMQESVRGEKPFTGSERLIIGAARSPKLRWSPCDCSIRDFKEKMKGSHRLHPLRSRGLFRYVDARQAGVSVGSHGVQLTGTATWKTDKGQSMKEGLLEEWENSPQSWDPRDLEDFRGILVSFCTTNARRVRLVELLATDSLIHLIDRVHWGDRYSLDGVTSSERKRSFVEALESDNPFALRELWEERPEWHEDLGNALLTCLRALSKTGYDEDRRIFNVLWVTNHEKKLMRLEIDPAEHSWVKMLKETDDNMTMAVLVEDCLGSSRRHRHGRSCGHSTRPSILETAISVNRRIRADGLTETSADQLRDPPPWRWADRRWQKVWDVGSVSESTPFWISPTSRLRVVRPLTNSHLLLKYDPVRRERIRAALGFEPGERDSHWEYTTDVSDDESATVRPIPVHIQ